MIARRSMGARHARDVEATSREGSALGADRAVGPAGAVVAEHGRAAAVPAAPTSSITAAGATSAARTGQRLVDHDSARAADQQNHENEEGTEMSLHAHQGAPSSRRNRLGSRENAPRKLLGQIDADALLAGSWLDRAVSCASHGIVSTKLGVSRGRISQWPLGCLPPMRALPAILRIPSVGRELVRVLTEYVDAVPAPGLDARDDLALVMAAVGSVAAMLTEFMSDGVLDERERAILRAPLLKLRDRVDGMLRDMEGNAAR